MPSRETRRSRSAELLTSHEGDTCQKPQQEHICMYVSTRCHLNDWSSRTPIESSPSP